MSSFIKITGIIIVSVIAVLFAWDARAEDAPAKFKVIAFYTGKDDQAHISFVKEANHWFPDAGAKYGFMYEATTNWNDLNAEKLTNYQVVLFLDTRPESPA